MGGRGAEDLAWLRTLAVAAAAALGAMATFGVTLGGPAWLKVASGGLALTSALLALLLHVAERRARLREQSGGGLPGQQVLSRERLDQWCARLRTAVLEARVEEGGQLDQMVRYSEAIDMHVRLVDRDGPRPRMRVSGHLLSWAAIRREWDTSRGRLVILGDPGFGKTVAALMLVAHMNAREEPDKHVAELFSLTDWYRWNDKHAGEPLGGWLAEQLTLSYPSDLPLVVSRHLIAEGLVLPVLDGLDEIPTVEHRRACVDAIAAYTRRVAPHRPFVLTCRAAEYAELVPDCVIAERHIVLAGLSSAQIGAILNERTSGRTGWNAVRARHAGGDPALDELFRSPLRLMVALEAYRDRDPTELLELSMAQVRDKLWELLLSNDADTFEGATAAQIRGWLGFLAAGMKRNVRERLMLHDLYLIDPKRGNHIRRFRVMLGLSVGLAYVLALGQVFGTGVAGFGEPSQGPVFVVLGVIAGASVAFRCRVAPITRTPTGWRARARLAMSSDSLARALMVSARGFVPGGAVVCVEVYRFTEFGGLSRVLASAVAGLVIALGVPLLVGLVAFLAAMASAGDDVVTAEPPTRFAHKQPNAVLVATRNRGLVHGITSALAVALPLGLVGALLGVLSGEPIFARDVLLLGLILGLVIAPIMALTGGLDAWLYHYWLRRRLRAQGHLPRRVREFLLWCAEPPRGWLRITNAYEFRHRELLDHLAPIGPPPQEPR